MIGFTMFPLSLIFLHSARSRTGKFPGEAMREIDMQKETIRQLRERIQDLENGLDRSRPRSRERLPPM